MSEPGYGPGPAAGAAWARSGDVTFPAFAPTVANLLRDAMARHPDNLAVVTPTARMTYAELDQRSAALAALLVQRGAGKGTHVGILFPNDERWVIAWAAAARIGAVATPVNTFYATPELATMLRHADVHLLITCREFAPHDYVSRLVELAPALGGATTAEPLLLPELPQLRHVLVWDDCDDLPWAESVVSLPSVDDRVAAVVRAMEDDVVPADPMLITYTSGSTGAPKGVVHSQGALLRHGHNLAALAGLDAHDRIWTPMPLCWVGGFAFTLLRALAVGAAFVTQERMDAGIALELLGRERVTCVSAWPATGAQLLAHPDYEQTDLSALRLGTLYEARPPDHRPADPGLAVTSLGMSETIGPHTFWTAEEDRTGAPEEFRGTFGHEVPGVSHRIVDDEGHDAAEAVEGEVWVRGYSLMLGLHRCEREDVFDADGWYHTGDRGYFDRGWFFFTGRSNDLIKTAGANVAPAEVEAALVSLDGVRSAFVFGVDDAVRGQEVVALVVPEPGADDRVTTAVLVPQLRERLSSYKVPKRIFAITAEAVPFLTSQKPDRRALAAMATDLASQPA